MVKKDAFIQTDNGACVGAGGGVGGDFDVDSFLKQVKVNLEKLDMDEIAKHIKHIDSMRDVNMYGVGRISDMGDMCGMRDIGRKGIRCMVGGAAGLGMISSIVGYVIMLSLVILALACLLGYVFYLKYHNNCDNKECFFSLERDFIDQIKNDICKYVKKCISCVLKKSVCLVKNVLGVVNVSMDIYNKSVNELIMHIDGGGCCGRDGGYCGRDGGCC